MRGSAAAAVLPQFTQKETWHLAKKKNTVSIRVIGGNADHVTGSSTLVETGNDTFLIEAGMIQNNHNPIETYHENEAIIQRTNKKKIRMVFVSHLHIDHTGLICAVWKNNPEITVIVPEGSTEILREMLLDSAFIMERDCEAINLRYGRSLQPFYTPDDVERMMKHVVEYPVGEKVTVTDDLLVKYVPSGHIFCACQIMFYFKTGGRETKLLYTGDLGNTVTQDSRIFVENFQSVESADIVLGESTYGARARGVTKKDFKKDLEKIKIVVEQYCIDNHARVLIPTFSLDRTPYVLWLLYCIWGQDESFDVPIVVDSPLAVRLLQCYSKLLQGEAQEQFEEMMRWKNIEIVVTPDDSKAAVADGRAKVIVSASGMLTAGRSVKWCQSVLPRAEDIILLMGYCAENTLGYKIQNSPEQRTININGKPCKNKANVLFLRSFSSHMQREQLLDYYSSIKCERLYLIHGDKEAKQELAEDLREEICKKLKTTRVVLPNRSTVIHL